MVTFHLSDLAGPTSLFLSRTHEISELVLARMALVMDQSRCSPPAPFGKSAGKWNAVAGKYVRALEPLHSIWPEPVLFGRPDRLNDKRPSMLLFWINAVVNNGYRLKTSFTITFRVSALFVCCCSKTVPSHKVHIYKQRTRNYFTRRIQVF